MVDLAEIQAAYYMVAATGVLVAAVYYIYNMRISQKNSALALRAQEQTLETRQAQLFMQIYMKTTEKEFMKDFFEIIDDWKWSSYDDYEKKYVVDKDNNAKFYAVSDYFEGIGVLVKRKLIDSELVDDMISSGIIRFWEKTGPVMMEWRARYNFPQVNEHVEFLYNEVKQIFKKQHPELFKTKTP
jgi:hypothetical protein